MRTSSTKNSLIIGISIVLGASMLSVGISNAGVTTIKACAKKSNGAMRLIDASKKCKNSERTLSWGTKGNAGATGPVGASGISYAAYSLSGLSFLSASGAPQTINSLDNLSSGDYLMQATLELQNDNLVGQVRCRFYIEVGANMSMSSPFSFADFSQGVDERALSVNYAIKDLPGGTYDKIDFHCYVNGENQARVRVNDFYMSATKVDTLVSQ